MVCIALVLVASGLLLATGMHALWQLFVLWGLILGLGSGMTALVMGATIANRWFEQRRGLVLGILTASSATGQLVFLPLAASLDSALWMARKYPTKYHWAPLSVKSRSGQLHRGRYGGDPIKSVEQGEHGQAVEREI